MSSMFASINDGFILDVKKKPKSNEMTKTKASSNNKIIIEKRKLVDVSSQILNANQWIKDGCIVKVFSKERNLLITNDKIECNVTFKKQFTDWFEMSAKIKSDRKGLIPSFSSCAKKEFIGGESRLKLNICKTRKTKTTTTTTTTRKRKKKKKSYEKSISSNIILSYDRYFLDRKIFTNTSISGNLSFLTSSHTLTWRRKDGLNCQFSIRHMMSSSKPSSTQFEFLFEKIKMKLLGNTQMGLKIKTNQVQEINFSLCPVILPKFAFAMSLKDNFNTFESGVCVRRAFGITALTLHFKMKKEFAMEQWMAGCSYKMALLGTWSLGIVHDPNDPNTRWNCGVRLDIPL